MNQENYCSLNVAKRLIDTGIVLETEAVWRLGADGWKLLNKDWVTNMMSNTYESYPAPSFAEIWRELPLGSICVKHNITGTNSCWSPDSPYIENDRITDVIAELLIWVKGQEVV
jgi:hypothetical protein